MRTGDVERAHRVDAVLATRIPAIFDKLALEITPAFVIFRTAFFSAVEFDCVRMAQGVTGHSDQVTAPMVAQEHGVQ